MGRSTGRVRGQAGEEAGLEEAGCLAERSCLEIVSVTSCVNFYDCVHSSCSHRLLEPGWLINSTNLSLMVLEAGKVQGECTGRFSVW